MFLADYGTRPINNVLSISEMAQMFKALQNLVKPKHELPASQEERYGEIARHIVRRQARGNVRLTLGDYKTKKDVEREFKEIENYSF